MTDDGNEILKKVPNIGGPVKKEELPKVEVTEEMAAKYRGRGKGRVPEAIKKQVVAINHSRKPVQRVGDNIKVIPKMDLFLEEFLKNGGNATQAALSVFNCTSVESAAAMGHSYLKKAKGLARIYLEKQGVSYGKLLDVATQKMMEAKTPEWWDRLMKIAEYADFMSKDKQASPVAVNIFKQHNTFSSDYIEGEEVEEVKTSDNEEEQ